jgi:CHAD domain-containing protein
MAFELKPGKGVPKAIRRVVIERSDKALAALNGQRRAPHDEPIHSARKRLKEIRATLRLVRGELGEKVFRRENRAYRDAGRPLSGVRDAAILIETLDNLVAHFMGRSRPASVSRLRRTLEVRRRATRRQALGREGAATKAAKAIRKARPRVKEWPLRHQGWKALRDGLRMAYGQGQRAMKHAGRNPSDTSLHEWRKRAQDLRYALELLQPEWPEMIKPLAEQTHRLTDLLGEDHDLAGLRTAIGEIRGSGAHVNGELIDALIDERRQALRSEAFQLGRKLYDEPDAAFVKRLQDYWKASKP